MSVFSWRDVPTGLLVSAIWAVLLLLLTPVADYIEKGAPGVMAWFHSVGWLAFLVTASLWWSRSHQPWVHRAIVIHAAEYGERKGFGRDVTNLVRAQVSEGSRLNVDVKNDLLGGDPSRGRPKQLRVTYSTVAESPARVAVVREHSSLILP
jgi:hypothetical protein